MSDTGAGGSPPAGWYDDPEVPGGLRWWDGSTWTDHRRPGAGGPPQASTPWAPAGGTQTPAWQTGAAVPGGGVAHAGARVDTWLWQSILATIFCCQPLGIVAIVFAAQAQSAVSSGDIPTAREKAATARTWTLVAASFGVVVVLFFLLFGFSGLFLGW